MVKLMLKLVQMNLHPLLEIAKEAAKAAAIEILKIYETGDFSIEAKSDESPLTKADKASHNAIVALLEKTDMPILSEEGAEISYQDRKNWDFFWMIDPLDGTKEFIKRNGEFTVNIALIHNDAPVLGVVQVPVMDQLYYSIQNKGAFKETAEGLNQIFVNTFSKEDSFLKVVASRSHMSDETQEFVDELKQAEIVSKGSSLKLLMVAEGEADLYPRYAPTMEWDTAAAHAIVIEAGGKVFQKNSNLSVEYNKENLLNPHFLVSGKMK